ncbi:MAG: penicillin-binding protein 2 [Gammaproteobacteria bacterium]|jgi:penicillin-binding protein 2
MATRLKDHWREQRLFLARVFASGALVIALTLFVMVRLVDLQVLRFEHFSELSLGNRIRIEPLPPTRGLIYDRNGTVLAENLPSYQLEMIPEQVTDIDASLEALVELGLLEADDLDRVRGDIRRQPNFRPVALRYRLSEEEVARFAVRRQQFPGVEIQARLIRHYPYGSVAVHALGYVGSVSQADLQRLEPGNYAGTTHTGKIGVEFAQEDALHGGVGYRQVLVNAQGRILQELERDSPTPGADVYLTLDLELQLAAEAALGGRRGSIVALDPRNGHVLALVSQPGYDPNSFSAGISTREYRALQEDPDIPLFNRALRGLYPPGSTIKPAIGLAGLHYGAIAPWQRVYCLGYYTLPGSSHRFRDWKREGHGPMNLNDAIAQSCDVYFYELALKLGIDNIHAFLAGFGLGHRTEIDVPAEKAGTLPSREWKRANFRRREDQVWFPGETLITGIGQGYLQTTPLQLAQMTATLATRGRAFRPTLVAAVRYSADGEMIEFGTEALPPVEVSDPAQWDATVRGMVEVMYGPQGTARASAAGAPYRIAGKTGTAQVVNIAQDEEYDAEELDERLRDHALFIAFAPVEDPLIAVAVVVENGGSGSTAAAPVARAVLDDYLLREQR